MSVTRKNLLVPGLKISKELADDCLPGEFLFGSNLTQKLDTAKSLLNVSKDLKLPTYQNKVGASKPALAPRRAQKGGGGQTRAVYTETSRSSGSLNSRPPTHRLGVVKEETTLELDINYHLLKHLFSHKSQITLIIHMMKTN
ncbi:unnamed protein product [Acanthoscelides obtectus]|uniref:Uncharacterized protein n=1 Tax=Acanthoscelides obtectus TaxID=200917 RepID=A0A9P0M224_ACAOB|nr:unnamed protein product [Acanthoscelides obtectus]CAK1660475.1 hypothetical protein AOBTE_LOCUS22096 [Acanthoscelides obtectus]